MMRAWAILVSASLQVLVLGFMAGQREAVVLSGRAVRLRSAPVDPRDVFRGDYVRLSYEASTINRSLWQGGLPSRKAERGERVYALLEEGADGLARVAAVTDERPSQGLFLRGRVHRYTERQLGVKYGLEAYFMQQGEALELEQGRVRRDDGRIPVQVPLDMDVAIGGNGLAVLRGHRWAPLGMGLRLERRARTTRGRRQPWTGIAELALLNASERPVAIVDLPNGGSFELLPIERWQKNPCRWPGRPDESQEVRDEHVRLLAPGERHTVRVDLNQAPWHVAPTEGAQPRSVVGLEESRFWFRLVYRPPPPERSAGVAHAAAIWHGELQSPAFNGRQRVD